MDQDIKKFFLKIALFTPLVLVLIVVPTVVLWKAGELTSTDAVIRKQMDMSQPILVGKAYSGRMGYYALNSIRARRPDVIALGSSRVMPFRTAFFKPGTTFYNAGGGVMCMSHFREFLNRLPDGYDPKVIIAGIDQPFLNADWPIEEEMSNFKKFYVKSNMVSIWTSAMRKVGDDYRKGKFRLKTVFAPQPDFKKIGLSAITNDNGTLNDGSHYYGDYLRSSKSDSPYWIEVAFGKMNRGEGYYTPGSNISAQALSDLEAFLQECQRRNIYVVGFLPPFAHEVYVGMERASPRYSYLLQINQTIEPLFAKYGFKLFDFSDLEQLGASDEEIYDSYHGTEKAFVRLWLKMIEGDPVLQKITDPAYLQERLSRGNNPYAIFSANEF
jgi:hypothetical protein